MVACLQAVPWLERLVVHGHADADGGNSSTTTIATATLLACLASPHLRHLELHTVTLQVADHPQEEDCATRLAQALCDNHGLKLWRWRHGRVPTSVLLALATAMRDGNRTLRYLDIGHTHGVTDAVAQTLTAAMACNTTFRSLGT